MKTKITNSGVRCYCGYFDRLKHKDCVCPICKTRSGNVPKNEKVMLDEVAKRLAGEYQFISQPCAIRLTLHHSWLINQVR